MNSAYLKVTLKLITVLALLVLGLGLNVSLLAEEAAAPSAPPAPAVTNTSEAPKDPAPAAAPSTGAAPVAPAPASAAPTVPTPSLDELQNMQDMAALIKKNSDAIGAAYLANIMQTLLPIVAMICAIAGWIAYAIVGHIIALMIAPLRAGLVRAIAYGAVQGIVIAVLTVVLFFAATPVVQFVLSWGENGDVQSYLLIFIMLLMVCGVSFIVVAALVYEIPFSRAMLFGLMVFFTGGFIAVPVFYIVFMLFKPMIKMESTSPVFHILAEKLVDENAALRVSLDEKLISIDKMKAEAEAIQKDKAATEKALAEKRAKLAEAQKADWISFSMIGPMVDEGKRAEAIAAYKEFAEKRTGDYAILARERANALEAEDASKKATAEKARQDAERAKVDAENRFQAKVLAGEATVSEVRTRLLGLSREQVIALLGQPSERQADVFIYSRIRMIDPVSRERKTLAVRFQSGAVLNVSYAN
ncbi:MAG: hypothetical protein ACAI35_14780 [Candidatus Methylacidiphilales bacterium]|nr:cell envelope integrity protein TolA [Candidatus Methylacidiphilales bacterium]